MREVTPVLQIHSLSLEDDEDLSLNIDEQINK